MDSFGALLFLLFWAMFVAGGNIIVSISYATHVFTSTFVALSMPWFGRMMDARDWHSAFLAATLIPLVGFAVWLWVNRPQAARGSLSVE